ncbi:flagellar motor switch protein FliN [Naasia sp. SYSU D00948]|uniref:flagellar motor switch protein FliN n=1 Tax=Naasia sp. SYSU D00948 TaxID=2817379 RepID=UPI001B30127D|nr:flagellar motor switch protein FliN [Naasia sp. SYSU D00948]
MNFPAPVADTTVGAAVAETLVRHLPGAPVMATRHAGGLIPPRELSRAVRATFVGARSAELALILLDREGLAEAAGGDSVVVDAGDVLRPALERAAATLGDGMLGEAREGDATTLFSAPDTAVFDLVGEAGVAGWFAVGVRGSAVRPAGDASLGSRLGRISNVEMTLAVEIGRTRMSVRELLAIEPGAVIELDRSVGTPADVLLNGRLIAHGEIVVVDQEFAVRITKILDSVEAD